MTPKLFGLMLWMTCLRRARSACDLIFDETETLSPKGMRTRNRPGNEISQVNRGPFVEIGSLVTCTSTSCPCFRYVCTLPSFPNSGSMRALLMG